MVNFFNSQTFAYPVTNSNPVNYILKNLGIFLILSEFAPNQKSLENNANNLVNKVRVKV